MRSFLVFRRTAAALICALPLLAFSQAWPTKPIKWIIPYPPGGITDSATRMVIQKVQDQTGWIAKVKAVNSPALKARFKNLGIEGVGNTPEQAAKFLDGEIVKWDKVISAAGVKAKYEPGPLDAQKS